MDYQSTFPTRSNSDPTTVINEHQSNFKAHWPDNNMYSQQSKKHLLGGSFDENKRNHNFGKIYSTKQSLSVDSMPRRDSIWQSLTKSATNLLGKHLNNTGSILKNWSSINTPLSVTVVSPDLYKSLQGNKDHQMMTPTKGFFAANAWIKETNQPSDDLLSNNLYNAEIMPSESLKKDTDPSDSEKRWNEYKCMYINCNDLKTKDQDIVDSVNNSQQTTEQQLEQHFDFAKLKKDLDTSANFGNIIKVDDDELVMLEKPESPLPQTQQQSETSKPSSSMVNTLLTTYNKVVNGAVDLLQRRSTSPDSTLFTKRACSPKHMRPKKHHSVAVGRGRGRAKSQLRRSGVSQKRHRKESGRHAVEKDLKNDIDAWEEVDYCESTDEENLDDVDECDFVKATAPACDLSQRMCTPKKSEWIEIESSSSEDDDGGGDDDDDDDGGSDDQVDEGEERNSFRSRLSSCNSEDSYCIVFDEDASDNSSEVDSLDGESESESEIDNSAKKVRFNLVPTVHRMIAWKFAYKAARRNQDLINKEHFRARIARTGRMLDSVLKPQFRDRIYHERFEE